MIHKALEFFARIGMGQFEELPKMFSNTKTFSGNHEKIGIAIDTLKRECLKLSHGENLSPQGIYKEAIYLADMIKHGCAKIVYVSDDGCLHNTLQELKYRNEELEKLRVANQYLEDGWSIYDILHNYGKLSDDAIILKKVTKDTALKISYFQCCDKPGYKVTRFELFNKIYVFGDAGSWTGSYGASISLTELIRHAKETLK